MRFVTFIHTALLSGVLCAGFAMPAVADTLRLKLNLSAETIQNGKSLQRPKSLGMATLVNGVKLPAYQVYYQDGIGEPDMSRPSLKIDKKLDSALAGQFAVYFFAGEWFLIPKNWHFVYAGLGANGSSVIYFAPPKGQNGHFSAWTNGACYGCGLDAASYYFQEADKLNQQEYDAKPQYLSISPKVTMNTIRPHTKAWRATINGQNIDGVAYFNLQEEAFTKMVQVSLTKTQNKLATPILNWHLR